MRVPVIDNGGQWTHREYRVLRDLGVETEILPYTTPFEKLRADGIVLSGGTQNLEGTTEGLGEEGTYLDMSRVPVLAICVGHQFMATHFGGKVARAASPEFGRVSVKLETDSSPLFLGVPPSFVAWGSHNNEVSEVPAQFRTVATSETCRVEAMVHDTRPLFGLQFHPEVEHTEHGERIFQNFLALCHR
ncbi:MAG: GMP synthase subunit A [Candidatus Thermoplasmatota archaeon]|jgi:GMP synthase (glutamine-hydrolysing)|nr:GMP synthase subunit A [Candidatus Thermoplasmatota archaeon]